MQGSRRLAERLQQLLACRIGCQVVQRLYALQLAAIYAKAGGARDGESALGAVKVDPLPLIVRLKSGGNSRGFSSLNSTLHIITTCIFT
jgi:hypothetical protein